MKEEKEKQLYSAAKEVEKAVQLLLKDLKVKQEEKPLFKIWMKYRKGLTGFPEKEILYSNNKKFGGKQSITQLLAALSEKTDKVKVAILYDNRTKQEILRITMNK